MFLLIIDSTNEMSNAPESNDEPIPEPATCQEEQEMAQETSEQPVVPSKTPSGTNENEEKDYMKMEDVSNEAAVDKIDTPDKDETMVNTVGTERMEMEIDATNTMDHQPKESTTESKEVEKIDQSNSQSKQKDLSSNPATPIPAPIDTQSTKETKKEMTPNFEGKKLGGKIEKEAYALLSGQYEDTKTNTRTLVNVPITILPAILGRTQKTTDKHVFDLGYCKALSRKHAVIFYTDSFGGKLGQYKEEEVEGVKNHKVDDDWMYIPPHQKKVLKTENIIRPSGVDLPQSGFYAIECISKNKLTVNGLRVDQGRIALLQHGSAIRMSNYYLYFALPENDSDVKIVSVPHPIHDRFLDSEDDDETLPPSKKARRDIKDLIEGKTLSEMIEEFIHAVDTDIFERRHSLISGHILYHAVQDVSNNSNMQDISRRENGVSRSEIMQWIDKNDLYAKWVTKMLTKLETKSYQANLSKALIKAGFTRIGTTGRHVKWLLPPVRTVGSGDKSKTTDEMKDLGEESEVKGDTSKENDNDDDDHDDDGGEKKGDTKESEGEAE